MILEASDSQMSSFCSLKQTAQKELYQFEKMELVLVSAPRKDKH